MDAGKATWPEGWRRSSPNWDENAASMTEHPQVLRKVCNPWSTSTRRSALCPVLTQILPAVHSGLSAQLAHFIFLKCLKSATALVNGKWCVCSPCSRAGYTELLECKKGSKEPDAKVHWVIFSVQWCIVTRQDPLLPLWEKLRLWGSATSLSSCHLPPGEEAHCTVVTKYVHASLSNWVTNNFLACFKNFCFSQKQKLLTFLQIWAPPAFVSNSFGTLL